jgi:hypothetical protein
MSQVRLYVYSWILLSLKNFHKKPARYYDACGIQVSLGTAPVELYGHV